MKKLSILSAMVLVGILSLTWLIGLIYVHNRNEIIYTVGIDIDSNEMYVTIRNSYYIDPVFGSSPTFFPELYGFTFSRPDENLVSKPRSSNMPFLKDDQFLEMVEYSKYIEISFRDKMDFVKYKPYLKDGIYEWKPDSTSKLIDGSDLSHLFEIKK